MITYVERYCWCMLALATVVKTTGDRVTLGPHGPGSEAVKEEPDVDSCHVSVVNKSALEFKAMLERHKPNFVRFRLWINNGQNISHTKEVILPSHWVWTYYSPNGFFPYLKWPVDFSILSFGLLDVKTQPRDDQTFWLHISTKGNCSLRLGEENTTQLLGYALRDMTDDYLLELNRQDYSFTFYCYLEEAPAVKTSLAYTLALYIGYPVEFTEYKCCRTGTPKYTTDKMYVECLGDPVAKMFQVTTIPYLLSLLAFIYCPVVLLRLSSRLVRPGYYQPVSQQVGVDSDWVFLTGKSPLTISALVTSLCGLATRHPVAVSRVRRLVFVLLCPGLVYTEVLVYHRFQPAMTRALLQHGLPMGYLSLLGTFDKSRENFMPVLGGPYVLLGLYYTTACLILLLPSDLGLVLHRGCSRRTSGRARSPLCLPEQTFELYSGISIRKKYGYAKSLAIIKAGLCMLANPVFWSAACLIQARRFHSLYTRFLRAARSRVLALLLSIPLGALLVLLSVVELVLCILYYGLPILSIIIIASKGYAMSLMDLFDHGDNVETQQRSIVLQQIMRFRLCRYCVKFTVSCLFLLFVISFCTLFTSSFSFVSKLLVFSLVSVVVYPSFAFGYLFFSAVLLFYVYQTLTGFGEGYTALLADAVEVSQRMDQELDVNTRVWNGTVFLSRVDATTADISRIQIHDTIVNLSTDQRSQIREATGSSRWRTRERHGAVGVPRELFETLIQRHRPVHIQVAKAVLWLGLVLGLMAVTISIFVVRPQSRTEGISEVSLTYTVLSRMP